MVELEANRPLNIRIRSKKPFRCASEQLPLPTSPTNAKFNLAYSNQGKQGKKALLRKLKPGRSAPNAWKAPTPRKPVLGSLSRPLLARHLLLPCLPTNPRSKPASPSWQVARCQNQLPLLQPQLPKCVGRLARLRTTLSKFIPGQWLERGLTFQSHR